VSFDAYLQVDAEPIAVMPPLDLLLRAPARVRSRKQS